MWLDPPPRNNETESGKQRKYAQSATAAGNDYILGGWESNPNCWRG